MKHKYKTHKVEGRTITAHSYESDWFQDFYHVCLTAPWPKFFASAALSFVMLNVLFALLYMLEPTLDSRIGIANLAPQNFWGYFFFSVETLATVGYGDMHPQSLFSHGVATVEVFVGMASVAVLTGLVFARFSKPKSRILFSNELVISNFNGQPTLMLRAANARQNQIANATAKMHVLIQETTLEGKSIRRIYDLNLMRTDQPMFFLTWTIMHPITPTSPLFGMTPQDMADKKIMVLIRIVGFDESIAQDIQTRKSYSHCQVLHGHQFVDVSQIDPVDGTIHIDYQKFHLTEKGAAHE
jgi:inward rectifier potassium channel